MRQKSYHKFAGEGDNIFIKDLRNKVNGIDNIQELRVHYNRIFTSSPDRLIKIFPENLNGRNDLPEFITNEIALAATRMLDKLNAVQSVLLENAYNDLIQIALESRVSPWGWTVKDQTRRAFSPAAKDLGEIDLDIQDFNKNSFITCEAFILRDKQRVQSHIQKVVADYTHKRKNLLILVYYVDKMTDFESKWKEYSETIVPGINFPVGYEMTGGALNDLTEKFGYKGTAIKIGSASHGTSTTLFHVFINVNYRGIIKK